MRHVVSSLVLMALMFAAFAPALADEKQPPTLSTRDAGSAAVKTTTDTQSSKLPIGKEAEKAFCSEAGPWFPHWDPVTKKCFGYDPSSDTVYEHR